MTLTTEKPLEIRFSEIDMMKVVWHGSYPLYFEDAREAFGRQWGLGYMEYMKREMLVPVVELNIQYKKPLVYGDKPLLRITYVPTKAAKIIFDYEIVDPRDGSVYAKARSVQVFTDAQGELLWFSPDFYEEWKQKVGVK